MCSSLSRGSRGGCGIRNTQNGTSLHRKWEQDLTDDGACRPPPPSHSIGFRIHTLASTCSLSRYFVPPSFVFSCIPIAAIPSSSRFPVSASAAKIDALGVAFGAVFVCRIPMGTITPAISQGAVRSDRKAERRSIRVGVYPCGRR